MPLLSAVLQRQILSLYEASAPCVGPAKLSSLCSRVHDHTSISRGDFHPLLGDDELKGKSRDLVTAIHDEEASQDIRGVAPGEEEHQLNAGHKHESFNGNSAFFCTSSLPENKRRVLPYFCGALLWMESALRQGGDFKETFAEILYDLQWYMMVLRSISLKWIFQDSWIPPSWLLQQVDCDGNLSERDNDSLLKAAKQDQEDLKLRLGNLKGDHACHGERCTGMDINQQCLASQLLNKMKFEEQFQAWPTQEKKNYHEELYNVNRIKLTEWPFVVLANLQELDKGGLLGLLLTEGSSPEAGNLSASR
ncbi:unnamed protein product [Sphagnum jensenii]|uniref:Uncharacterized protein n=1 Tax=Sphagnum jensenii TaxID=128206 RepID=A0ABP1BJK5_9BRYO